MVHPKAYGGRVELQIPVRVRHTDWEYRLAILRGLYYTDHSAGSSRKAIFTINLS